MLFYIAIHFAIIDLALVAGVIRVFITQYKAKKAFKGFRKES